MRIISGRLRGRKIETLETKQIRPTTSRTREAVFNILMHGRYQGILDEALIGDFYCGSGALGIESLSRGAAACVFVDKNARHMEMIRHNLERFSLSDQCETMIGDSSNPPQARKAMDIIFLDPPYNSGLASSTMRQLRQKGWTKLDSIVVVETGKSEVLEAPEGYVCEEDRIYGISRIRIFRMIEALED